MNEFEKFNNDCDEIIRQRNSICKKLESHLEKCNDLLSKLDEMIKVNNVQQRKS